MNQLPCSISSRFPRRRDGGGFPRRAAPGFALPVVVFFMVVVAMLVAAMTRLSMVSRAGTDIELQAERAQWAAKSAMEYMRHAATVRSADVCDVMPPVPEGFRLVVEKCSVPEPAGSEKPVTIILRVETAGGDLSSPEYASWREQARIPRGG